MENNELTHHGIKGQKWGVRRFQNRDGTLTLLGRRRKNTSSSRNVKEKKNENESKKTVKDLSDEELRARINRLQLEKQYNEAIKNLSTRQISKGRKMVEDMMERAVKNIGEQYATYLVGTALNKINGKEVVNPKKGQKEKSK